MQRAIVGMLLVVLLLAACSTSTPTQPQVSASGKPVVTVYKSST
jgi:outer membrane biogenesis lipoprotein LolB